MKKLSIGLLLALSCAFTMGAVACSNNDNSSSSSQGGTTHTVSYTTGDGYEFSGLTVQNGASVGHGGVASFKLDVGAFYTGTPIVYANENVITPNDKGVYNVQVLQDTAITVSGIYKDVSNMSGLGTFDNPFQVTRPIDLLHIAKEVNKGNQSYVNGTYVLMNDIDCKGEELEVIGDLSTDQSYFAGLFTCDNNQEVLESARPKISNFVLNTDDTNYVGLFGAVMVDLSVQSSALIHGIVLDNFTINASISESRQDNYTLAVGGLIGYGIGANIMNCDITNGTINLYADEAYFSFAGGAIGYQQASYMTDYDQYLDSQVINTCVDVDIRALKGAVLGAGGIVGQSATTHPFATPFVLNSYSTGNISGAIRAGGIVGGLGEYAAVSNCYATGEIVANSTQNATDADEEYLQFCYAAAGGLVGYAENNTIVHDSFSTAKTYAFAISGTKYQAAHSLVGSGDKAGYTAVDSQKYVIFNCMDSTPNNEYDDVDLKNVKTLTEKLGWKDHTWILSNNNYPIINFEAAEGDTTTITQYYLTKDPGVTIKVNNRESYEQTYLDTMLEASNYLYAPLGGAFVNGSLPFYYAADNEGYISYGYYLDEACTMLMPYGYVPVGNVKLYVPFAKPSETLLGEYDLLLENGESAKLTLSLDEKTGLGVATYSDGATTKKTSFYYTGDAVLIDAARFARYFTGAVEVADPDNATDLEYLFDVNRYNFYNYKAIIGEDGTLQLFDGTYFTESNPLLAVKNVFRGAYYDPATKAQFTFFGTKGLERKEGASDKTFTYTVNGDTLTLTYADKTTATLSVSALSSFDAFKGTWTKSATSNKNFVFDGMGNWSYTYVSYQRSYYGSAQKEIIDRANGTYTVVDGTTLRLSNGYVVTFNENGALSVKHEDGRTELYYKENSLNGKWKDFYGSVTMQLDGIGENGAGSGYFTYDGVEKYHFTYEMSETAGFAVLYIDNDLYGYFTYSIDTGIMNAMLYDPMSESGFTAFTMFVIDDFDGVWISNNTNLDTLTFNGNGFVSFGAGGKVTINDEEVSVSYTLTNATLTGKFVYGGETYVLTYDEDNKILFVEKNGVTTEMERKDVFADKDFIDLDGNSYAFDGKSNLLNGGSFTMNETKYGYKKDGDAYNVYENGIQVGDIQQTDAYYTLTLKDTMQYLYLTNEWMGEWAVSGAYALLNVGPTDLDGNMRISYQGVTTKTTTISTTLFRFTVRTNLDYYLFIIENDGETSLVLSESSSLLSGDYSVCSKANDLFGTWVSNRYADRSVSFDGVTSVFQNGQAKISRGAASTDYYYMIQDGEIVMWSQEVKGDNTLYYKVVFTDNLDAQNAYRLGDRAFILKEADALYLTKAKDENGVIYTFDGENVGGNLGTVTASNGKTYSYKVNEYFYDNTASITFTDKETGETYDVTLNYQDRNNVTITLEKAE